jgi:hypothetical protein
MQRVEGLESMSIPVLSIITPARMPAIMDRERYQYLASRRIDCFVVVASSQTPPCIAIRKESPPHGVMCVGTYLLC